MHFLNKKDSKKRKNFFFNEKLIYISKTCFFDRRLNFKVRFILKNWFYLKYSGISSVRIRNRCILTGRSRFIFRYFCLSRMAVKSKLAQGMLGGFKRI